MNNLIQKIIKEFEENYQLRFGKRGIKWLPMTNYIEVDNLEKWLTKKLTEAYEAGRKSKSCPKNCGICNPNQPILC